MFYVIWLVAILAAIGLGLWASSKVGEDEHA